MSITHSELRKLNRRFGEAFGFNHQGQPIFRFVHTDTIYRRRVMERGMVREGYLYVPGVKVENEPWSVKYGKCWILAKWHCYTEAEWFAKVKNSIPFPKQGEWEPVENIRLGDEYNTPLEPTNDIVTEVIGIIRDYRDSTIGRWGEDNLGLIAAEIEQGIQDTHDKKVNSHMNTLDDILRDSKTFGGKIAGSHGQGIEYMSGGAR